MATLKPKSMRTPLTDSHNIDSKAITFVTMECTKVIQNTTESINEITAIEVIQIDFIFYSLSGDNHILDHRLQKQNKKCLFEEPQFKETSTCHRVIIVLFAIVYNHRSNSYDQTKNI